jgi:hypothetical protein
MSGQSPASVLYDSTGTELAVIPGSAIPAGTRGILVEGTDGTDARTILTDINGRVIINQGAPNSLINAWPVELTDGYGNLFGEANNPIWVQGTIMVSNPSVGTDGAAALGFDTQVGGKVTTVAPTYTNGNLDALSLTTTGLLRVDGSGVTQPVSGTVAVSSVAGTVAVTQSTSPWVVSGTVTANAGTGNFNNASVGVTAAAPPADATYMGALVTTAAESGLTSGDMYPLNLTTTGQLRIDGIYPLATVVATAVDMAQVGGVVTAAAPAYTTATVNALSLTTVGGLRLDGVYPAGTANASAPDVGNSGGYVTTAAPVYTTGQLNPLSLDVAGNLRVTGFVVTNKASTSSITSVAITANANNALLASNVNRIAATIYNDTNKLLYVKYGTTASTTSFSLQLLPNSYFEVQNDWNGEIDAFAPNGASGAARVSELTA